VSREGAANGMTAVYVPEGVQVSDIVPRLLKKGIIVSGGIHKEIRTSYFRIGHSACFQPPPLHPSPCPDTLFLVGISVVDKSRDDLDRVIKALRETLEEVGYKKSNQD
jgi:alanine-glyoxylate transaminase/serine-glyoxylate transaminase/serine-pyruvate transaminase